MDPVSLLFGIEHQVLAVFGWDDLIFAVVMVVAGAVVSKHQQDVAKAAQREAQKKAEIAAEEQSHFLAGQSAELTTQQMQFQVGQREIAGLTEALTNQTATPRILTLPSNQPAQSWVDKANASIDSFIKG